MLYHPYNFDHISKAKIIPVNQHPLTNQVGLRYRSVRTIEVCLIYYYCLKVYVYPVSGSHLRLRIPGRVCRPAATWIGSHWRQTREKTYLATAQTHRSFQGLKGIAVIILHIQYVREEVTDCEYNRRNERTFVVAVRNSTQLS